MSRPVIPAHVKNLIQEIAPYMGGAKDMDVIFAGLLSLKEKYILPTPKIGINNPKHPYYCKATPEEEKGLAKSFEALKNADCMIIKPGDNVLEALDKA